MNIFKPILTIVLLFIIITVSTLPLSLAISNDLAQEELKNNLKEQENSVNELTSVNKEENLCIKNNIYENEKSISNIDVEDTQVSNNENQNGEVSDDTQTEDLQISDESQTENPFYDLISIENMNLLKNSINIDLSINNGILVKNDSKEAILELINGHGSYTYSVDSNGFIICDNILRINNNLDTFEPSETEMDYAIKEINDDKLLILLISSFYYNFDENQITTVEFNDTKYLETYEYDNTRVIILNSSIYNNENNISYNPDLADSFIKALSNIQYKVLTGAISMSKTNSKLRSSRSIVGTSIGHQTVWGGPNDNGTYATIGSVDDGEEVYILGKEDDYYHIQYVVTVGSNSGKERSGYILRSSLDVSIIDKLLIQEEVMTGGYRYSSGSNRIESCDDVDISINSDSSISNTEGITLLYDYEYSDWTGKSYQIAFIEYSTSNGMKRGYIKNEFLINPFASTLIKSPDRVITYTGPDSEKFSLDTGAVGLNEYACAIGYKDNYVFLEYNTNSGRRRAFAKSSDLNVSISSLNLIELPDIKYNQTYSSSIKQDVSAGPGACYTLCAYRGAIGKYEPVYKPVSSNIVYEQLGYSYIVYHVGSSYKGGYVPSNTLTLNVNPTFPEMPTYDESNGEFARTYIGQTGLGQPLYAYKIGTGNNKIYLCFNQHGWEDGGTGDGVELVLLAKEFMQIVNQNRNNNVTSSTSNTASISEINFVQLLQKWTIYVIPSINRDGITSGWTNYGPGRSDVSTAIDINRNWDTSIYTYYSDPNDPRNYNGTQKMATSSAQALAAYLNSDDVKPNLNANSILLDIHGWDNEVITWDDASEQMGNNYFVPQFSESNFIGYSNNNSFRSREKVDYGAGGYLMRWAVEKLGTTNSMLLELPLKTDKTIDHDFIVNNNYSTKLTTAILNMMKNEYNN